MSADYNPSPVAVAPAASSSTAASASDYGTPVAPSATVGADSASVRDDNLFSAIGYDQTDAAAVAKVLKDKKVV